LEILDYDCIDVTFSFPSDVLGEANDNPKDSTA
jgi:hypothetical protein